MAAPPRRPPTAPALASPPTALGHELSAKISGDNGADLTLSHTSPLQILPGMLQLSLVGVVTHRAALRLRRLVQSLVLGAVMIAR